MTRIFISYRHDDAADVTGRINDRLVAHFGKKTIFTDVDHIPLGVDFRQYIDDEVAQCEVLLAVMGRDWLTARLNDEDDYVRIEIESALHRKIPVIPLLVRDANMPTRAELPESLHNLVYRNYIHIRPDPDFNHNVNRLIDSLDEHLASESTQNPSKDPAPDLLPTEPASLVTDFIRPDMLRIPAGSFMMGSDTSINNDERPVHHVMVPAFELARNALTWAEWQACEVAGGCHKIDRPKFWSKIIESELGYHPVVNVTINNINDYLVWINSRTGQTYRLPSEAEWEYAARAGSTTAYQWGVAIGENHANCDGCSSQWDGQSTAPVGSFDANPFGLNDMYGNVWERVADCWHDNYKGAPDDGSAWMHNCTDADHRPLRGGSWIYDPDFLLAAYRSGYNTDFAVYDVGFRLARTVP